MSPIHSNKRSSVWGFPTRVPHPMGSCTLGGPSLTSQRPDEQRAILQQLFDELVGSLQLDLVTLQSLPKIRAVQIRIAELQSGQPHGPGAAAASRGECGDTANTGERWGERRTGPRAPGSVQLPGGRAEAPGAVTRSHRRSLAPWGWRGLQRQRSLLTASHADRGDSGARLAGGASRRLGPAGKPAPCAERTRAGLQLQGRPSSTLPAPRCPRPVPARSLPCALCSPYSALLCCSLTLFLPVAIWAHCECQALCAPNHLQSPASPSGTV